ncbi:MAG TPA: hypothetical protein VGI40_11980 [Pirellulaceae bacterium]
MEQQITIAEARGTLVNLVGRPFWGFGRAANMLMTHFGEMREGVSMRGDMCKFREWGLHTESVWRLCQNGRIIVAYRDFYYDPSGQALEDDWSQPGCSFFDHVTKRLNEVFSLDPPRVEHIETDDVGGFSLKMSAGYRLDVFPDTARHDAEHWRLIQSGDESIHFVFWNDTVPRPES